MSLTKNGRTRAAPGRPLPLDTRNRLARLVALVGVTRASDLLSVSTSTVRRGRDGAVLLYGSELALILGLGTAAVVDLLAGPRPIP